VLHNQLQLAVTLSTAAQAVGFGAWLSKRAGLVVELQLDLAVDCCSKDVATALQAVLQGVSTAAQANKVGLQSWDGMGAGLLGWGLGCCPMWDGVELGCWYLESHTLRCLVTLHSARLCSGLAWSNCVQQNPLLGEIVGDKSLFAGISWTKGPFPGYQLPCPHSPKPPPSSRP
jgi:hypothetical protein